MKRPDISRWRLVGVTGALVATLALGAVGCGDDDADADPASPGDVTVEADVDADAGVVRVVTPAEGAALIDEGATLVDVRTPDEYAEAHIDGAVLIDVQGPDFEAQLAELPTDATYVVYCRSGNRSAAASARMAELGFTDVNDMGGIADWVDAGYPVVEG